MNAYPENPPEDLICECGHHLPSRHCDPSGEGLGASPCSPCFVVLAFRYGGHINTFPIGVFPDREDAEAATRAHRYFRGGKYDHHYQSSHSC